MRAYVVTENLHHSELLKRLLPAPIVQDVQFIEGGRSADSMASSVAAVRQKPVALVMDAHTTDEVTVLERKTSLRELLKLPASGVRSEVFLARPELEAIYFYSRAILEQTTGRELTPVLLEKSKHRPKDALEEFLSASDKFKNPIDLLSALGEREMDKLRQHPLIQQLDAFLSIDEVTYVFVNGPMNFLDTVAEAISNYRRQKGLYYMGIIDAATTEAIHFRKGVDKDDAKDLVDLALNKIAEEYGLQEERDEVDLYFE